MSTLLDQETVVLEGLDFEPPCDSPEADPHAAEFSLLCRACRRNPILVCGDHLRSVRAYYDDPLVRPIHTPCGAKAPTFDELVIVRPL